MCLIIHRPLTKKGGVRNIPNDVIEYNLKSNPDGYGIAWREKGELHYRKFGPDERENFRQLLKETDKRKVEYVAHFRFATHGPKSQALAHPFAYTDNENGEVLVFHNGIIGITTPPEKSDTQVFVEAVLAEMPWGWWKDPALKLVVEMAGYPSRFVVMTETETILLNERQWEDADGGVMYSCSPLPRYTAPATGGGLKYLGKGSWEKSKTAEESAKVYEKAYEDSKDPDDDYESLYGIRTVQGTDPDEALPSGEGKWTHMGHHVNPLDGAGDDAVDDPKDETCGVVECLDCRMTGEYYVIEGKVYIDLAHKARTGRTVTVYSPALVN